MTQSVNKYFLDNMVLVASNAHLERYLKCEMKAVLDLSNVPENTKNQLLLNLRRGYCSSVTGVSYVLYRTLAHIFEFPVFSLGRGHSIIIAIPKRQDKQKVLENLRAVWLLARPETDNRQGFWHDSFMSQRAGLKHDKWHEYWIPRVKTMDMGSVCGALGVNNLWQIIPKSRADLATSALLRGSKIELKPD